MEQQTAPMKIILLVDDDPESLELYRQLLTGLSPDYCILDPAYNGYDALLVIEQVIPDLIILDLIMPWMSGAEFLQSRGYRRIAHKTKVLLMLTTPWLVPIHLRAQVHGILGKPFEVEHFEAAVTRLLT